MKIDFMLSTLASEFLVLGERYRKGGRDDLAEYARQHARSILEAFGLPKSSLTLRRFVDLLSTFAELEESHPRQAEELKQYLNNTLIVLRDWADQALRGEALDTRKRIEEEEITAEEIPVSKHILYIQLDEPVGVAIDSISTHNISQLPVLDQEARVVGLLTQESIVNARARSNGGFTNMKVRDVLPEDSLKMIDMIPSHTVYLEVLRRLAKGAEAILVVDQDSEDRMAIITHYDCIRLMSNENGGMQE